MVAKMVINMEIQNFFCEINLYSEKEKKFFLYIIEKKLRLYFNLVICTKSLKNIKYYRLCFEIG